MELEETQSIEIEASPPLQYEQCEYCSRSFFKGKLKYHLKLCTADSPMTISPKRTAKIPSHAKPQSTQRNLILGKEEKTCQQCHTKFPPFLYDKHIQRCRQKEGRESQLEEPSSSPNPKSSTEVNFKERGSPTTLPLINRSVRHKRHEPSREPYQVKLREELSCFRRAQQIKQVQCPACSRIFSKEASLRHVPICQALRNKERLSIALKRKGNRSVGDQMPTQRSGTKKKIMEDLQMGKESESILEANPEACDGNI